MSQINGGGNNSSGLPTVDTLTGNTGGAVGPDGSNNINILGAGSVSVSGNPGTHTLTISISGAGLSWSNQNTSFLAAVSNGYVCTAALTVTMPASPSLGDVVIIGAATGSSVVIQGNTGQTIRIGNQSSSVAGTATSTTLGNSVVLTYIASTTTWSTFQAPQGTWTLG